MNYLIKLCDRLGILRSEIDYHVLRASMVLIFLFFGYQKWFEYEAQALIPYINNGPLISWMYPVFGVRGACWFLGVSEWTFGALIFIGFWNKTAGVLGALGGIASFVCFHWNTERQVHPLQRHPKCRLRRTRSGESCRGAAALNLIFQPEEC